MAISFDSAFGVHEQALKLRGQRAEVMARNLANADTPNYQARDLDFKGMMEKAYGQQEGGSALRTTDNGHIGGVGQSRLTLGGGVESSLMYRLPTQPSIDGNTVETDQEMARFSKNSTEFQASFTFLNSKIRGLVSAIRGD